MRVDTMNPRQKMRAIEKNHLAHFAFLPKVLGFDVAEINGVTVINCGLGTSMFNIAYGAPKPFKGRESVEDIKQAFGREPFAWWIPPSSSHPDMTKALLENGLVIETIEHAMMCVLDKVSPREQKTDLRIQHVTDKDILEDFIRVLDPYDPAARGFYERVGRELFHSEEKLVIGYSGTKPVTIGILFLSKESAGIFSLITNDEERGKGYGTDMMIFLMQVAKEKGCQSVTLSASSDAGYRIYERLGFEKIGEFDCFESSSTPSNGGL